MGNGEAKELISRTHRHELRPGVGNVGVRWGAGWKEIKRRKNGTM